ncbi:MAG: hypothetical protein AAF449_04440 [Myxococcota bacterium]
MGVCTMKTTLLAWSPAVSIASALLFWSVASWAQSPESSVPALPPGVPAGEPSPEATIDKALGHFRVTRDVVGTLGTLARVRGLLPTVSGSYLNDSLSTNLDSQTRGDSNLNRVDIGDNATDHVAVSATWDFRELVFNPSEIDVYALVSLQRDLILEVSRTYYLRQQLQIQRATNPPKDAKARHILDLRIREFTTLLNAFTGGWFTRTSRKE